MSGNGTDTFKSKVLAAIPLVAVAAMLLGAAAELLPIDNVFKITLARLLVAAGLVAVVAMYGLRWRLFKSGLEIPLAFLLVAAVAATAKSGHGAPSLRFLIESIALFYLVVALFRSDIKAAYALALVALVGVAISSSEGVSQVAQGLPTGFYRDGFTPVVVLGEPPAGLLTRAIGSFANPNLLATHLLLLTPLAAVTASLVATRQLKIIVWGIVALACLGLVLAFSRAGIGAALLAGLVALYAAKPALRKKLMVAGLAIAVVLLAGVLISSGNMVSGFGRPLAYSTALDVIDANRVFGVGLGRAADVMNTFEPESSFRHAHDLWLTWWVEAGPLALVAWLWIAAALLWRSFTGARAGNLLAAAALMGLVGFFAFSLLDHPANVTRIATTFWIVAGIAAAATPARSEASRSSLA